LALTASATAAFTPAPAQAIDEVLIQLPLLETTFRVRVSELMAADGLQRGDSDLAELDRASDGAVGRQLRALLLQPLPLGLTRASEQAVGTPMLEQAMLMLSSFGRVEGSNAADAAGGGSAVRDLSGRELRQALLRASGQGQPTLLGLIEALPGERVTLNLGRVGQVMQRMLAQRRQAERLVTSLPPAAAATLANPQPVRRRSVSLVVPHRPEPLERVVLEPQTGGNGRLVLISHGLWDGPASFEGWGRLLAGQGSTVVLPRHPGSDSLQQRAMLSGQAAPPSHQELALRPKDLSSVLDAAGSGQLELGSAVDPQRVVVLGHSWGATTALLLAGVQPSDRQADRCSNADDPDRNLSWALQCSWLDGVDGDHLADSRVIAVGAVSPPVSLLFTRGSAQNLTARILLVSGSRDWVVPPDPEAINPIRRTIASGNRLVLAQGGDHFNLRPGDDAGGGILGPLLLRWSDAAFAAGPSVRPAPGAPDLLPPSGWGDTAMPLVDVSPRLAR
jgi:predicted dienelactone hydrolase